MNKKLFQAVLLLFVATSSLQACKKTSIQENEVIAALMKDAHRLSAGDTGGDTNYGRMEKRFRDYDSTVDQLSGGESPIITKETAKSYKETGKANLQWFESVWKNAENVDKYINTMAANCSWILSPVYLLDIYNYGIVSASFYEADEGLKSIDAKGKHIYYSCAPDVWTTPSKWRGSISAESFESSYDGDKTVSVIVPKLKQQTISKVKESCNMIKSLLGDDNNGQLNKYIKEKVLNNNDFFYELKDDDKDWARDEQATSAQFVSTLKLDLDVTDVTKDGNDPLSEEAVYAECCKGNWKSAIGDFLRNACINRRFAYVTISYKAHVYTDYSEGDAGVEKTRYSVSVTPEIINTAVFSEKLLSEKKTEAYQFYLSILETLHQNPRLLHKDTIENVLKSKMVGGGIATVHNLLTDTGNSNELINTEIFEFNYTSDIGVNEFNTLLDQYEKVDDSKSKKSYGDAIFGYLTSTNEVLTDSGLTRHFQGSKHDKTNLKKYVKIEEIMNDLSSGRALSIKNQIGLDFVYVYYNIPLYALKMYELKQNARNDQLQAIENKKEEGYINLVVSESVHQGIPVLFRYWSHVDVLDEMNGEGFTTRPTGVIYSFKDKQFYYKRKEPESRAEYEEYEYLNFFDPDIDKLTVSERESLFAQGSSGNADIPYTELSHTFFPAPAGHVLLAEYRALYKHEVGGEEWYPIGRKIYLNKKNINFSKASNGEYKWMNSETQPVALFSDPESNLYPNGKAYGISIDNIVDSSASFVNGSSNGDESNDTNSPFNGSEEIIIVN